MRGIPTSCLPFVIDKEADSQVTAIGVIQEKKCHWDKNATGTGDWHPWYKRKTSFPLVFRSICTNFAPINNKLSKTNQKTKRKSYEKNSSVSDDAGGDDSQCTVQIRGLVARQWRWHVQQSSDQCRLIRPRRLRGTLGRGLLHDGVVVPVYARTAHSALTRLGELGDSGLRAEVSLRGRLQADGTL